MQKRTSVDYMGANPPSPAELYPDFLDLIAGFLPGGMVATGLLGAIKSLLELEQARATTAALCFKDFRSQSPDLLSVETDDCFVIPSVSATAALFVARFPKLASANLLGCLNQLGAAVGALAEHCPGLTSVNSGGFGNFMDAAVVALAKHCQGLTSVNLGDCGGLIGAAVVALAEHCLGLTWMNLGCC